MSGRNKLYHLKPLPNKPFIFKPLPKTTNSRDDKIPSLLQSSPKSNNLRDIKIILEYNEDYIKLMNKVNRRQHIQKSKALSIRSSSKKESSKKESSKKESSKKASSKKESSKKESSKKASSKKVPIKNNTFLKRIKMFLTK